MLMHTLGQMLQQGRNITFKSLEIEVNKVVFVSKIRGKLTVPRYPLVVRRQQRFNLRLPSKRCLYARKADIVACSKQIKAFYPTTNTYLQNVLGSKMMRNPKQETMYLPYSPLCTEMLPQILLYILISVKRMLVFHNAGNKVIHKRRMDAVPTPMPHFGIQLGYLLAKGKHRFCYTFHHTFVSRYRRANVVFFGGSL